MLDFSGTKCHPQQQSSFFRLPLELREECYRESLSTLETGSGLAPYIYGNRYALLYSLTDGRCQDRLYCKLLSFAGACKRLHLEVSEILFREQSCIIHAKGSEEEWLKRTGRFIRRVSDIFDAPTEREMAERAKREITQVALVLEGGQNLSELHVLFNASFEIRDAPDPQSVLPHIGESFTVKGRVEVEEANKMDGISSLSEEQMEGLRRAIEVDNDAVDWLGINQRAATRLQEIHGR